MRMKPRISGLGVAGTLLGTVLLTGCGGSSGGSSNCEFGPKGDAAWSKTLEEGARQRRVVLYHAFPPEEATRLFTAFKKVCPAIQITATRGAAELVAKVDAQIANKSDGTDVFVWADEKWFQTNAANVLPLSGPGSTAWPRDAWVVPGKAVRAKTIPLGYLVWNTKTFPKGFTGFQELTHPSVKGRLGTRADLTSSYVGYLEHLERTYGPEYMAALGAQKPKFYPSAVPLTQAVASGEVGVINVSAPGVVKQLQAQGAPIRSVIPKDSFSVPFGAGALTITKRPAAAQVFLQFLLSREGQQAIAGDGYGESPLDLRDDLDLSGSTVFDATKLTPEVKASWTAKFKRYFQ